MTQLRTKNKTLAALLAALGGSLGLHRFYLYGISDKLAWLPILPSALGWWGVARMRQYGQDDMLSWLLLPPLGITLAAGCLAAVIYVLTPADKWNAKHNPQLAADAPAGMSHALSVGVLVFAMLAGTVAFMSTLAFSVQKYFEHQVDTTNELSQ
jgi:TM2 domain-containing membrane protein YozV